MSRGGDRVAAFALAAIQERGEREGREGVTFSPPPIAAPSAYHTAYRLAYHAAMPSKYEEGEGDGNA